MDPASLAFGVVSLSMQLVQTASAIKDLISTYKSAAKELDSLYDRLDDIETICQSLELVLSDIDNPNRKPWETALLKKLHRIIQECCDKVSNVYSVFNNISSKHKKGRNPLKSAGFLFLQHRDQIVVCTNGLDKSLSSLQLYMTANILALSSWTRQPQGVPLCIAASGQSTRQHPVAQASNQTSYVLQPVKQESEVVFEHWTWQCMDVAFLQRTRRRRITYLTGQRFTTDDDSTFTFGSSLLNKYIQLSIQRGSLAPFCIALQIPRILLIREGATELGDKVNTAFVQDDLETIQKFFSEGLLTAATLVAYHEHLPGQEGSLLGLAMAFKSYNLTKFLVSQMHGPSYSPRNHISNPVSLLPIKREAHFLCVIEYIHARQNQITPIELCLSLEQVTNPHYVKVCLDTCRQYFPYGWQPCDDVLVRHMKYMFSDLSYNIEDSQLGEWASLFAGAIERGLEIYHDLESSFEESHLAKILETNESPHDVLYCVQRWIDLLELAGVDLERYLRIATERCFAIWKESNSNPLYGSEDIAIRRVLCMGQYKGYCFPYWTEMVDEACPIRDLLLEYPTLRYSETTFTSYNWLSTMWFYQDWNSGSNLSGRDRSMNCWPVAPPLERRPPDFNKYFKLRYKDYCDIVEWADRAFNLMESRFERRQMRKLHKKTGKKGRKKTNSIPGAWVE
ncbi:hypothetical protein F53441_3105 [Fusarium austroafricanum]|uniref:Fungal N-terminal domain-containing protein n=1 Tax=Fusarium austroafricanum TaxID=2364996 RepID=A0A8H4KRG0_9HYPO|nr:hypothetical protein F53441_3105 [Fusarium austroafricanum]